MFNNIDAFGRQLFLSLFLIVCCIVAAHLCFGYDTRRAKEAFVIMILLLMIGVQYYFLVDTVSYVPATRFFVYNVFNLFIFMSGEFDIILFGNLNRLD